MYVMDSSFWQYKVYAYIHWLLWTEGVKRHCVVENGDFFSDFGVYIFGSFRVKANVIIQYYLVPRWLFADLKTYDLE